MPRGCLDDVRQEPTNLGIRTVTRDEREQGRPLHVTFAGQLRPEQMAAAEAVVSHDTGVLAATTAFGKTVIAAWLIAQRRVNTLVLVHRRQLLDQWVDRLSTFLCVPAKSIGRVAGGRKRTTGLMDVALIQSLIKKGVVDDLVADYGHVIVDECHHLSAQTFESVVRQTKARFVVGLSATVARKDGHHPIVTMQCGPVRYRVNARVQAAARPFEHVVLLRPTGFRSRRAPEPDRRVEFQALYQELVTDGSRNQQIAGDVIDGVNCGRSTLVLTERNDHLDILEQLLAPNVRHQVVLRAGTGKKERQAVADRLATVPTGEGRVLLATGKYVGEGFDDPRLDSLFLTLPVSWRGTVGQYAGRGISRWPPGVAYRNQRSLRAEYVIADRVQRIWRVGGRSPLRRCARRRGAGWRPTPVGSSRHRRDRRKDQLLQESGYFVLRFLAEDVGKELDTVLDAIQRALSRRRP
jgi:superfamily II DNA or RNA helicase